MMRFEIRFGQENAGLTVEKGKVVFHSQYAGTTTPMTVDEWSRLVELVDTLIRTEETAK